MGFNSTVLILNDNLHEIENDPEFGKKLARAIREHNTGHNEPHVTGQTTVLAVEHADTMQILAVGGNCGRVIGYSHWSGDDDVIIKELNRERLRRAKKKA